MGQAILLRGAKQLLTLRGPSGARRGAALHDLGIIEDGSVLIRDGIIALIGSTRRMENLKEVRGALEVPVKGAVVMPGFVDASLNLSVEDSSTGSNTLKRKKLNEFYDKSLALMRSCLLHGTLAAAVKASAGTRDIQPDPSALRQLAKIGSNPVEMIRTWRIGKLRERDNEDLGGFNETLAFLARRKLANFVEVEVNEEKLAVIEPLLRTIQQTRMSLGLLWTGTSGDLLADLLSRFHPRAVCCPSTISPAESQALSKTQSIAVFSPCKETLERTKAGDGARRLADRGAAIALSTGFDFYHAPSCSMQMAISLAVLQAQLTIEEAIAAATINAAYASGCGHATGSIEVGKKANLLVLMVPEYWEIPRQFGINHLGMAIRDGNIVLNRTRWKAAH